MTEVRLSLARARAEGIDFDTAWRTATAGLKRGPWRDAAALDATRNEWKAAYTYQPVRCQRAFSTLKASRE